MLVRAYPWRVFGLRVSLRHGLPLITTSILASLLLLVIAEITSQSIKPTELSKIWFEPNKLTAAQIQAQTPDTGALHLHKTGVWRRLCPSVSTQTFINERGGQVMKITPHTIVLPQHTGPILDKARHKGVYVPKVLAADPGKVRFILEITSSCWLLEDYLPIFGGRYEATFEIVP